MPPNNEKIMKINNAVSFSIQDSPAAKEELTLASPLFDENMELLTRFLPDLRDASVAFCRYC